MNSAQSHSVTQEMLDRMEEKILKNRPQIKEIREKYGSMSYFDYVKQKNRTNPHKPFQHRKKEVVNVIKEETTRLLGSDVARKVEEQLMINESVSTAEHTAPLGTPHTLGAGLSVSIPLFGNQNPRYKNVIILSCSGVSFNNSLSFSRGFQFHEFRNQEIIDNQFVFFGRATDPKTVLFYEPYSVEAVNEIRKNMQAQKREGKIGDREYEKIDGLLSEIYLSPHALSARDFPDQLTITNYYLWKKLFPSFNQSDIPSYVMLSQEMIVMSLLLNHHLDQVTPINKFILDPNYWSLIEKYFNGITGAFDMQNSTGTFLFWGLTKDNTRIQLVRQDNKLVSTDGSYSVELTASAIKQALKDKELFPGVLLTFVTLSFFYGLLLGGGASQPTYLTQMKEAYIKMMNEVGDSESAQDAENSVTDDFVFFRPHLAFIDAFGERVSATGMDVYLYNDSKWKEVINATKTITINEFITILLPILYKQFCPEQEREEALMNVSRQDVERFTGFDKKLPAIGTMNT